MAAKRIKLTSMFAKVFSQIFDSSIAENFATRHVFMDLLVLADAQGCVDMTMEAISRRTNVPLETVKKAIEELSSPDEASRSPDYEGRRLIPLDDHRDWGWKITNYEHYRKMQDEVARKAYWRDYRRAEREKKQPVQRVQVCSSEFKKVTHGEGEVEAEANVGKTAVAVSASKMSDEEWIEGLKADPTYHGIDIERERGKMKFWCRENGKQSTRRRFINWLNRADKPLSGSTGKDPNHKDAKPW